jgi:hypothetical protein
MKEIIMRYRSLTPSQRETELKRWRPWTFDEPQTKEEARLRKIISGAYLRLSRLDDSNPEVNHAREILEQALNGGEGSWP